MHEAFSLRKTYFYFTVSLLVYLFSQPVNIYIPAFHLTIWSSWVYLGYVAFSGLWFCFSPCLEACMGTFFPELLFFLFPIQLLLLLVFAQYHTVIAILLLLCLVGGTVAFRVQLSREHGGRPASRKLLARRRIAAGRLFVVLAAVLLSVPGLFSVFVYSMESPSYAPSEEVKESIAETQPDEPDPETAFLAVFRSESWTKCSAEERITALQMLHEYEAEQLGMPPVPVTAALISPTTLGYYTREENRICINVERLQSSDVADALDTLIHESYHAYQFYLIGSIDWEAEYTQASYFDRAREWRDNAEQYIEAEIDPEGYYGQPLESSARDYAEWQTLMIRFEIDDRGE